MRGVESQGMLCSASELGIDDDASGLLALPADAAVGADLRDALGLDDTLITLKITPNRADCLSILGIARDVAAVTGAPLVPPADRAGAGRRAARARRSASRTPTPARASSGASSKASTPTAPTPAWMKQRLERSGIRSISAVVDITNYVMLELGQPLHAYDDRLLDGAIVVRFARPGEKLTLLNEQVLDLEPDLLLVADEKKPLGLAGIMGGEHSGISDATTTVLLEGAFWNPAVIQGKSRRLGFASDAGYRFERGVDFAGCARAVERATQLILESAAAAPVRLSDVQGALPARDAGARAAGARDASARHRASRRQRSRLLFGRLGFSFERDGDDFLVTPPSYRFDLAIEEDFVEEIARLYGYDAIPAAPSAHRAAMLPDAEARAPGDRRQAAARRPRLAGGDHLQLRELRLGVDAVSRARRADRADRRAESDREPTST